MLLLLPFLLNFPTSTSQRRKRKCLFPLFSSKGKLVCTLRRAKQESTWPQTHRFPSPVTNTIHPLRLDLCRLQGHMRRLDTASAFQWSQLPQDTSAPAPEAGSAIAPCFF